MRCPSARSRSEAGAVSLRTCSPAVSSVEQKRSQIQPEERPFASIAGVGRTTGPPAHAASAEPLAPSAAIAVTASRTSRRESSDKRAIRSERPEADRQCREAAEELRAQALDA